MNNNSWERGALLGSIRGHLTNEMTVTQWDAFAKEYNYPTSSRLIHIFGSWNNVKESAGLQGNNRRFSEKELITIAKEHKQHFTSKRNWREYALQNNLPTEIVYISHFETWNNAKKAMDIPLTKGTNPKKYKQEDIKKIIKAHSSHFTSRKAWDQYAAKNDLPTYLTLCSYFLWEEILQIAGQKLTYKYTDDHIKNILNQDYRKFLHSSIREWNQFAKEKNYPTSIVFLKRYKTWQNAKKEIDKMFNNDK